MARLLSGQAPPPPTPQAMLRLTQAVYLMLIIGMLLATGVFTFLALRPGTAAQPPVSGNFLPILLLFVAIACLAASIFIPLLARGPARTHWLARADDDQAIVRTLQAYAAAAITRAAILESGGLFGAVTILLTANLWALLAPAVMLLLLVAAFPKTADLQHWLDHVTGGDA